MKINEYLSEEIVEDKIDYYYKKKTKEVSDVLTFLRKHNHRLIGKAEHEEVVFSLNDVYYFESVDKKTFAYLSDNFFKVEFNLTDLENVYFEYGFIRVNKSTVLNIYKINSLKSELNMKVIALLDNDEKIQINRNYKAKFNLYLRTMNKGGFNNETDN